MALETFIADESARRHAFPVAERCAFLAHAGVSPLPRRAREKIAWYAGVGEEGPENQNSPEVWAAVADAREAAARLLGCSGDEVALVGPTARGLNTVADGLSWEAGDEVVYYPDDYPANVYPWTKLADRGVRPVAVRPATAGRITWEEVERAISERTRLVSLPTCHFLSGERTDVDRIGRELQRRGIRLCVDAIQSLGAFPLSVEHVDFLAAGAQKWLLGPAGAGIFYVKASRIQELTPSVLGSWNVRSPNYIAQERRELRSDAGRFESGTPNLPGALGMLGGLEVLLDAGVERVGQRILELRGDLLDAARREGYRPYTTDADDTASGIVTLTHPDRDVAAVAERMERAGVRVSLRHDRAGTPLLRLSPHFYNTPEEIRWAVALMG